MGYTVLFPKVIRWETLPPVICEAILAARYQANVILEAWDFGGTHAHQISTGRVLERY